MIIFFWPFLRANFGQNAKIVYFCLILRQIQLVPEENLVEFVTLHIFKLCMSNKADSLVPNSYLNALYHKLCQMA